MQARDNHQLVWERRQTELWDRVFQATHDVVILADSLGETAGQDVLRRELMQAAMRVGAELVRANAAGSARQFRDHIGEAKMKAIETDYWLRLVYVLQRQENRQRDLSGIISQYTRIIALLQQLLDHVQGESRVVERHTRGTKVN